MLSQEQFKIMYNLQQKLNDDTNGKDWVTTGITNKGRKINWFRCIYMEATEAIDSLNWKHWKDINKDNDIENIKIEIVDIWHFIMSEHIKIQGLSEAVQNSFDLYHLIHDENKEIIHSMQLIECFEIIIKKSINEELPLADFFRVVEKIEDFDMIDVYKLYIGKNCLNQFRQDNGYKEGKYQKIWDGEEDNVYLQTILKENPNISYNDLYNGLKEIYQIQP